MQIRSNHKSSSFNEWITYPFMKLCSLIYISCLKDGRSWWVKLELSSFNQLSTILVRWLFSGERFLFQKILFRVDEVVMSPAGTFTLSNLGMFGVDRFDAILPPGQVRIVGWLLWYHQMDRVRWWSFWIQGAIMAVGASKPTVVTDADGFFSVKNKMLVN